MLKNHKNVYWTETRIKQNEENKKRLSDLQNKLKKNVSQEIEQKESTVAKNISYQTIDVSSNDLKNANQYLEESIVNSLYDRYFKSGGSLEQNIQKLDNDLSIAPIRNIKNYNGLFTGSVDKVVPKVYQEPTSYNNLTPVFVDPLLFPHESFLNISRGGMRFVSLDASSKKEFQKEWLLIRSFDEFVTIIPELFGTYEQPTRIPLALSLCFFFETTSIPRPLLTSYEEDPEMYQYEQDIIDKKSTQSYKPKNDEKTGLDCFRWLVQNNYVPEFVNLHDFNSRNLENNRELRALFLEWQERNNVLPKVQEHWF